MDTPETGGGKPHNLDLSSLKPLPEKREVGSGVKKPQSQGLQEPKKPFFKWPLITEDEPVVNEKWAEIHKKLGQYSPDQQEKIHLEWFDRLTSRFKPQDFMPDSLTDERRIEAAEMLEECIEMANKRLLEPEGQANPYPNAPSVRGTSGDSSSTSSR